MELNTQLNYAQLTPLALELFYNQQKPPQSLCQMRDLSTMIWAMNPLTNISPCASVNCADLGDVPPNPVDIQNSFNRVTDFISVMKKNIVPMTTGGDHLVSLPILRALAIDGPLGLIQFNNYTDLFDSGFGVINLPMSFHFAEQ